MCANVSHINAIKMKPNHMKIFAIVYVQILWLTHSLFMTDYYGNSKQFRVVKLKEGKSLEHSPMTIEMNICEGKQWK